MSLYQNNKIKLNIYGASHASEIGVVIEGLPKDFEIDEQALFAFLKRRAPGQDEFSTPRKEDDEVHFIKGLENGKITEEPLHAVIYNKNMRSKDYENLKRIPRPSHADFSAWARFGIEHDMAGGGEFSGRLTACMCIAGGILKQIFEKKGIYVGAHILSVGETMDDPFDMANVTKEDFVFSKPFPVLNEEKGEEMKKIIRKAKEDGDSVGGVVECAILGLPAGLGDTLYEGLEGKISSSVFAIPAVKGIEFGSGFRGSRNLGSENNDAFYTDGKKVFTKTNNHGGILGGITSGMPIVFRTAFKPTPSISKEQESVNLLTMENTKLVINGRHDPCIVKRAVPCVEAAALIAISDVIL